MRLRQAALGLLGLYVCLAATIAHRHMTAVGVVDLPWGLLLGLIGAYSIARLVDLWARLGAAFFGLGWGVGLTVPMFAPGGGYLVAQDWIGLCFLFGTLAAIALSVWRGSTTT